MKKLQSTLTWLLLFVILYVGSYLVIRSNFSEKSYAKVGSDRTRLFVELPDKFGKTAFWKAFYMPCTKVNRMVTGDEVIIYTREEPNIR